MSEQRPYLEHIYDPERIELAATLIEKELRKLFLGLSHESLRAVDASIRDWPYSPGKYHLEGDGPRDFWDSFAAYLESVKLKPAFTAWITAENVQWHKTRLPISQLQMTSPLEQLKKLPDFNLQHDSPIAEVIDALNRNPEARPEQKRLIDIHSTDPDQDKYPVIAYQTPQGLFKLLDGNRRTLKAVIYGNDDIEAWVGERDGEKLVNFWVPLNDMFQLVKVFDGAVKSGDDQLQQAVALVLKSIFENSVVAEQAYRARIGNQNEAGEKLFSLAQGL